MATATPTEQTQITSTIPKFAEPYAQQLLGNVFGGVDPTSGQFIPGLIGQGYEPYRGQAVAGFNPLQQQAIESTAGMQVAPQIGAATGLASLAGMRAGELGAYSPLRTKRFYRSPFLREGGLDPYMSPYMQGVIEQQKRQAVQDYARQIPGLRATSARAGALGGTRQALMESEAQRNLQGQLQNIQATGLQQAYQQAAQQAAQDAQLRAQYGLAGAQLGEQSRQFGAGLGMQGLQQQLAAAGALGGLGMQQYQQGMGITSAQLGAGGQMQALEQQLLNQQLQDFINKQQFPYKQAEFGMGILRGIPATGQTQTLYQQPGSLFGQIAGVGLGLGSLFGGLGGGKSS
jgi:hypothetical protein